MSPSFALHSAVEKNDYDFVKELLSRKDTCVNLTNRYGFTPLHIAVDSGYKQIAMLLLENGSNIESLSSKGETPIFLAIKNNDEDLVETLLEKGANVTQTLDPMGYTPMHCAVEVGNLNIIRILLKYRANINLRDVENGYTPLHLAVIFGSKDALYSTKTQTEVFYRIILFLLANGADINARNWDEETPMHCATRSNQISVIKLLIEKGADCTIESSDGDTPIDLITDNECCKEFIKYITLYDQIGRANGKYFVFWFQCNIDLQKMKQLNFNNTKVSWYTFMRENNDNKLQSYLHNIHINNELQTQEYKKLFPFYESIVEERICRGKRRQAYTQKIMKYFCSFLPIEDCWQGIFYYLDTSDLENVVEAIYN